MTLREDRARSKASQNPPRGPGAKGLLGANLAAALGVRGLGGHGEQLNHQTGTQTRSRHPVCAVSLLGFMANVQRQYEMSSNTARVLRKTFQKPPLLSDSNASNSIFISRFSTENLTRPEVETMVQ